MRTSYFVGWALLGIFLGSSAQADDGVDRPGSPYFILSQDASVESFPLESTRVRAHIAGTVAHVRVNQVYKNDGTVPIEAMYVFPAGTRAAVFSMQMTIGSRKIEAEIARRAEARARYETARKAGQTASLLEQERPNVFSMRVANILPGDRVEVELHYTELLMPMDRIYTFVYPTVVGPRFTGEAAREEAWTQNPRLKEKASAPELDVSVRIAAGMPIKAVRSPSHPVEPRFFESGVAEVRFDAPKPDRDLVLEYRLADDSVQTGLLMYPGAKERFFALFVEPPHRPAANEIPPREYIFIVDVSGSMSGFPIKTAQRLVDQMLLRLNSQDTFNIMMFAGGRRTLSAQSLPVTTENIAAARGFVSSARGGGGTHLLGALTQALALPRTSDVSTSFVVVTDGYVNIEKEAMTLVEDNLGTANLFAFGIGSSVNRHLIEGLSHMGRAEPFFVLGPQQAHKTADRFMKMIESPVLTEINVSFEGWDVYDIEPSAIPDLFAERPVVVFGKYRGDATGTITVTGASGVGRYERKLKVEEGDVSDDWVALEYLWARDRIRRLDDFARVGVDNESAVTALGLKHHLMTRFTSFVAVDSEKRNVTGPSVSVRQPLAKPYGMKDALRGVTASQGTGSGALGVLGASGGAYGFSEAFSAVQGGSLRGVGRGGGGTAAGKGKSGSVRARVRAQAPVVQGALSKDGILRVLRRSTVRFRRAYQQSLKSNPSLAGKITVRFTIGPDGRVKKAKITTSTLNDAAVEARILAVIRRLRFPKPSGGGTVEVSYPFVFSPR